MINNRLADRHTWAVCLIVYCAACTSAVASITPGAGPVLSIFFDHVPAGIDAPTVIEVTVYNSTIGSYAHNGTFPTGKLMKARVDRVIKGSIDAKYLTIFVSENSSHSVGVGRGIILGTVHDDPLRGIMLPAMQKAKADDWSKEFLA